MRVDGEPVKWVITGEAVDLAGNRASATVTLNIDKTVRSVADSPQPSPEATAPELMPRLGMPLWRAQVEHGLCAITATSACRRLLVMGGGHSADPVLLRGTGA
jgi:hypothetical protein